MRFSGKIYTGYSRPWLSACLIRTIENLIDGIVLKKSVSESLDGGVTITGVMSSGSGIHQTV